MGIPIGSDAPLALRGEAMVPAFALDSSHAGHQDAFRPLLADVHPSTFDEEGLVTLSGRALFAMAGTLDAMDVFSLCQAGGSRLWRMASARGWFMPTTSGFEVGVRHDVARAALLRPTPMNAAFGTDIVTSRHLRLEIDSDDGPISTPIQALSFACGEFEDARGQIWVSWSHLHELDKPERETLLRALMKIDGGNARLATMPPPYIAQSKALVPRQLFSGLRLGLYVTGEVDLYHPAHCVCVPIELSLSL